MKKKSLVLFLVLVMLICKTMALIAGSDEGSDTLCGVTVNYEAICNEVYGEACTQILASDNNVHTRAEAEVVLYVRSRMTGALSEYGSDTIIDSHYASIAVAISSAERNEYVGYEVSTTHYASVERYGVTETGSAFLNAGN